MVRPLVVPITIYPCNVYGIRMYIYIYLTGSMYVGRINNYARPCRIRVFYALRAEEDRALGHRRRGIYYIYYYFVPCLSYMLRRSSAEIVCILLFCIFDVSFFFFLYVSPTTTCGRVQHKQEIIRFEKRYRLRCYIRVIWICVGGSSRSGWPMQIQSITDAPSPRETFRWWGCG